MATWSSSLMNFDVVEVVRDDDDARICFAEVEKQVGDQQQPALMIAFFYSQQPTLGAALESERQPWWTVPASC